MRGYEWYKGTVRCGFCSGLGHNITSCTEVDRVARECLKKIQDEQHDGTFSRKEDLALQEIKRREIRKAKLKKVKRRKPRCSFCDQTGHKRTKCKDKEAFFEKVNQANTNWKKAFVGEMNNNGYGIGSLVSLPTALLNRDSLGDVHTTGVVVAYDKCKLNLFSSYPKSSSFKSQPSICILADGQVIECLIHRFSGRMNPAIVGDRYSWNYYQVKSIKKNVSHPPESFYTLEGDKPMEWFYKNVRTTHNEWDMIKAHVESWHKLAH